MTSTPAPERNPRPHPQQARPPGTLSRRIWLTCVATLTWPFLGAGAGVLVGMGILTGANSLESIPVALLPSRSRDRDGQRRRVVAAATPVTVALVAHGRRRDGVVVGGLVAALLALAVTGWGPVETGLSEDQLVEGVQERNIRVDVPPPSSGLTANGARLVDDTLTYEVGDGDLTHTVEPTRRTPRAGAGAKDTAAAAALVQRLRWSSPRSFARDL